MEEEDEPLLPREKLLRYDVTLLKKGIMALEQAIIERRHNNKYVPRRYVIIFTDWPCF